MGEPLDRLAELLPPPPPDSVPPTDWSRVEGTLGTALPADFKCFVDRWGNGGDIEGEDGGPVNVWPVEAREWQRSFRTMVREMGHDAPMHPEPGGLLVWGGSESEWTLLWDTTGEPDDWTVVVWNDDLVTGEPVATGLGFVDWLVAALEHRLPEAQVPGELWPQEGAAAPEWFPRGGG